MTASLLPLHWLRAVVLVVAAGMACGAVAALRELWQARMKPPLDAYRGWLRSRLAYIRSRVTAEQLVLLQTAVAVSTLLCLLTQHYVVAVVLAALVSMVKPALTVLVERRTSTIEGQLDHWLSGLAASLRVSPALGQALDCSVHLVAPPLSEELASTTQEMRLGVPVDEALGRLGARLGSHTVQSALGALRIGRNTGGDLPMIVERSASVLREMARLEGVIRTKTAEGRAQAGVVSMMPYFMFAMLHWLDPEMVSPLLTTTRGHLVLAAAFALWLLSLVVARKVLHVDY